MIFKKICSDYRRIDIALNTDLTVRGDVALMTTIWPNIERAVEWIDRYGDRDGDGFVEYGRRNKDGLINQGWKDSFDSIFHADGTLAEGPIALCEVQAYVYAARRAAATIGRRLGKTAYADRGLRAAVQCRMVVENRAGTATSGEKIRACVVWVCSCCCQGYSASWLTYQT